MNGPVTRAHQARARDVVRSFGHPAVPCGAYVRPRGAADGGTGGIA